MHDPIRHLAHVVVETVTPLSIGTGSPDGVFDSQLLTDANGLPTLAGTSLAGSLRARCAARYPAADPAHRPLADDWFGYQEGDQGMRSRVNLSWGVLLDSTGATVRELLLADHPQAADPLVRALQGLLSTPLTRERVRHGFRGAGDDAGKFDRAVAPAGLRFAFALSLHGRAAEHRAGAREWQQLLALLHDPLWRLGGGTRNGLGALRVLRVHEASFDLSVAEDARRWRAVAMDPGSTAGLAPHEAAPPDAWLGADTCTGSIELTPIDTWRIGPGTVDLRPALGLDPAAKPADLSPVTEWRVRWQDAQAVTDSDGNLLRAAELLLPASSLKGALAHRMDFHARCAAGQWNDPAAPPEAGATPETEALFGAIKDSNNPASSGHAGCCFLDDAFIPLERNAVTPFTQVHNSIDRFTGGVRARVLFTEESVVTPPMRVPITLDLARLRAHCRAAGIDPEQVRRAFAAAVAELCSARLALGGRSTSGNGFMRGSVHGSFASWLQMPAAHDGGTP